MWVLALSAAVTIATPKHWKATKGDGVWTYTHRGASLVIRATPHDDAHPLDLDGALHDLLATVEMDSMDEVAREEHDGYPTWLVMLHGEGRLGAAGVIDAGPVTITYVLDAPAARFAADAEVLVAAIESVRVDGAEGPYAYPRVLDGTYGITVWQLHFREDGTVEQDSPDGGEKTGTWRLDGDQLHLEFSDGSFGTYDFGMDDQAIYLDGLALWRN